MPSHPTTGTTPRSELATNTSVARREVVDRQPTLEHRHAGVAEDLDDARTGGGRQDAAVERRRVDTVVLHHEDAGPRRLQDRSVLVEQQQVAIGCARRATSARRSLHLCGPKPPAIVRGVRVQVSASSSITRVVIVTCDLASRGDGVDAHPLATRRARAARRSTAASSPARIVVP